MMEFLVSSQTPCTNLNQNSENSSTAEPAAESCNLPHVDAPPSTVEETGNPASASVKKKMPTVPYKNEISHRICRNPELAKNVRFVAALDAGIRCPIAVAVYDRELKTFQELRVRKRNLYHHENQQAQKLESMKQKNPDIAQAEQALGNSGTKNSYNLDQFKFGYMKDWFAQHETLFEFYGAPKIREIRSKTARSRKQMYDRLVAEILGLFGLAPHEKLQKPGEAIFIVEPTMIGTAHKGHRPSKHAAFWRYFIKKVF